MAFSPQKKVTHLGHLERSSFENSTSLFDYEIQIINHFWIKKNLED